MKQRSIIISLVFLTLLFSLSLGLPFFMLRNYNLKVLRHDYLHARISIARCAEMNRNIFAGIASDNMVKSSLVQYYFSGNLAELQNHLSLLKRNYENISLISLYDREGKLFLSTDYSIDASLPVAEVLETAGLQVSLLYSRDQNQYLYGLTAPLKNDLNVRIGYIRVYYTIADLLDSLNLAPSVVLLLEQSRRMVLAWPKTARIEDLDKSGLLDSRLTGPVSMNGKRYMKFSPPEEAGGFRLHLLIKHFHFVFYTIVLVNIFLLAGVIVFLVRQLIIRKTSEKDDMIRTTADDLIRYSQKALRDMYVIQDIMEDVNRRKEHLKTRLDKIKVKRSSGSSEYGEEIEFKAIKPN